MLGKLIKYEFKALFRELGVLYMVWLSIELTLGFFIESSLNIPDIVESFFAIAWIGSSLAVVIMTFIVIVDRRFYKNFYGDEGYFTFSLPVKASMHIWSKTIVTTIWVLVSTILGIMAIGVGALIVTSPDVPAALNEIHINGHEVFAAKVIILLFETIILVIVSTARFVLKFLTCVNIGAQINKFRGLMVGATFVALSIIEGIINIKAIGGIDVNAELIGNNINFSFIGVGVMIIIQIVQFAIYFAISNYLMNNRLNLE